MSHILLTWNPGATNDEEWTPEEFNTDMVEGTAEGRVIHARWSVARRVRGIHVGDRAFLLRQGNFGRGIVAVGKIEREPYSDVHFRDPGAMCQYVKVAWEDAVPVEDAISIETLDAETTFDWHHVLSSGWGLDDVTGATVDRLWVENAQVAAPPLGGSRGAGFGDAAHNALVEDAAMKTVRARYEDDGYAVEDVSMQNVGFDLLARNGEGEAHIEVKGVSGSLPRFQLTVNEFEVAQIDDEWVLAVVTEALGTSPTLWAVDSATVIASAIPSRYDVRLNPSDFGA